MNETVKDADQKAQSYSRAVEDATLETVRLVSSEYKMRSSFHDASTDRRTTNHEVSGFEFDTTRGVLLGTVRCRCSIKRQSSEGSKTDSTDPEGPNAEPVFFVNADYLVLFRLVGEHDRKDVETFFTRVAPLSVWPYFRVHVATTAAQANVNIPVLPIRKLVHRVKAAQTFVDPDDGE